MEAGANPAAEATSRAETTAVNFMLDVCIEFKPSLDYGLSLGLRQDDIDDGTTIETRVPKRLPK
jgi:hypothetical protein